ncbi:galactokinase [Actinoalloteichus caeruleus]|uniref:Galactokinase n=1 Tax=Actinoalloteichus caeruleus DSM 43889 TaxID=1120930 RepID=A0ABT1JH08_ACTCY|nr:galactokinase [Actinoalloteichus caeruleus]MCP2331775.1 galactokinase [Actinoalloteichus caeruleus DSM 43889]
MTPGRRAARTFQELHGRAPEVVWSAPGRANLIGEHTDYNGGLVLPFALPYRIAVAASPREDGLVGMTTVDDSGHARAAAPVPLAEVEPGDVTGWSAYPAGVAWVLRDAGLQREGVELVIAGDVPSGAGLSSSAALECAVALALLDLAGRPVTDDSDRVQVARWAQLAENDFVGAPTGVLDQMASLCCQEAHLLLYDVSTEEREQVPFDPASEGLEVLVIDSGTRHEHSESGYADRRAGCEQAVKQLGVTSLSAIEPRELPERLSQLDPALRPLARHVVTENQRVRDTVALLRTGRTWEAGALLTESHVSLRDDYRVSCPELDLAVDVAVEAGAAGARMMGGGFGGSGIALVETERGPAVRRAVTDAYRAEGLADPRFFSAVPAAGAGRDLDR